MGTVTYGYTIRKCRKGRGTAPQQAPQLIADKTMDTLTRSLPDKPEEFQTGGCTQKQANYFYDLAMNAPDYTMNMASKDENVQTACHKLTGGLEELQHGWALRNIASMSKEKASKAIDMIKHKKPTYWMNS